MTNFFCIRYRPHAPRGASGEGGYPVTAWRTNVLIRCYLQLSLAEALPWCNFFRIRYRPHAPRGASGEGGYPVTAWRTNVLIRCYLQQSLAEALPWCNFVGIRTERIRSTCFDVQKNCGVPDEEYAARFQTVLFMKLNIISNYFRGSF